MIIRIPSGPEAILDRLLKEGFESGLVGGCLRDLLLGLTPKDYDASTCATPEEIRGLFPELKILSLGENYGTLTLILGDSTLEITTWRRESGYRDYRHPSELSFTPNLEEDLMRRDFTVNGLYYSKNLGLVDLFGGQEDLKGGILRGIGNPEERFREDPLRILRGLRFASVYGFAIEKKTSAGMLALYPLLDHISRERKAMELLLLLQGSLQSILPKHLPILKHVIPGLDTLNPEHIQRMPTLLLKVAAFFQGLKDPKTSNALISTLRLSSPGFLKTKALKEAAELAIRSQEALPTTLQEMVALIESFAFDLDKVRRFLTLREAPKALTQILEELPLWTRKDLALSPERLLSLGVPRVELPKVQDALLSGLLLQKLDNEEWSLEKGVRNWLLR